MLTARRHSQVESSLGPSSAFTQLQHTRMAGRPLLFAAHIQLPLLGICPEQEPGKSNTLHRSHQPNLTPPQYQSSFHSPRCPWSRLTHRQTPPSAQAEPSPRAVLVFCAVRVLDKRKRGFGPVPPSPRPVFCVFCVVVGLWIVVLCSSQTQNCMAGLEDLAGVTMTGLDHVHSFSSLFFLRKRTLARAGTPTSDRHVTQPAPWTYTST